MKYFSCGQKPPTATSNTCTPTVNGKIFFYMYCPLFPLAGSTGYRLLRRHIRDAREDGGYITQDDTPDDVFDVNISHSDTQSMGWNHHIHERHHITEVYRHVCVRAYDRFAVHCH